MSILKRWTVERNWRGRRTVWYHMALPDQCVVSRGVDLRDFLSHPLASWRYLKTGRWLMGDLP